MDADRQIETDSCQRHRRPLDGHAVGASSLEPTVLRRGKTHRLANHSPREVTIDARSRELAQDELGEFDATLTSSFGRIVTPGH